MSLVRTHTVVRAIGVSHTACNLKVSTKSSISQLLECILYLFGIGRETKCCCGVGMAMAMAYGEGCKCPGF